MDGSTAYRASKIILWWTKYLDNSRVLKAAGRDLIFSFYAVIGRCQVHTSDAKLNAVSWYSIEGDDPKYTNIQ